MFPILIKYGVPPLIERLIYLLIALIMIILIIVGYVLITDNKTKTGLILMGCSVGVIIASTFIKTEFPLTTVNKILG